MDSNSFIQLQMRIIDWYENLNESNTLSTGTIEQRIPPFLQYSPNNKYSYIDPSTKERFTFTPNQQNIITDIISNEIRILRDVQENGIGGTAKHKTKKRKSKSKSKTKNKKVKKQIKTNKNK